MLQKPDGSMDFLLVYLFTSEYLLSLSASLDEFLYLCLMIVDRESKYLTHPYIFQKVKVRS